MIGLPSSIGTSSGILIFKIADKELCSDIKNVTAVLNLSNLNHVSRIESEIMFHNKKFKLIDIHKIYGLRKLKKNKDNRIILLEMYSKKFGFIVDKVVEILTLDEIFIEKSLEYLPVSEHRYISGKLKIQDRKIFFPYYERISKELEKIIPFKLSKLVLK